MAPGSLAQPLRFKRPPEYDVRVQHDHRDGLGSWAPNRVNFELRCQHVLCSTNAAVHSGAHAKQNGSLLLATLKDRNPPRYGPPSLGHQQLHVLRT